MERDGEIAEAGSAGEGSSRSDPAALARSEFERVYLKTYPDVAEAVARGLLNSGHQHWLLHGRAEGRSLGWTKAEIINFWADVRGYRTYLEISTPTTGGRFAEVDHAKYPTCHRLIYRCPRDYADGGDIDFRSAGLDIGGCVKQIKARGLRYDVILVDAFHEYETSLRDLKLALDLVAAGGTVIVHDCDPPHEEVASPHFVAHAWTGVTYRAYLDVVIARDDLTYFTVDTDWGCGVIRKQPSDTPPATSGARDALIEDWRKIGNDNHAAFAFLRANREALLNLVSVEEFLRIECEASVSA
jgi:hypothetical protein